MADEWKVATLSREATARIDNELASSLIPIKKDFEKKAKASLLYLLTIESTTSEK